MYHSRYGSMNSHNSSDAPRRHHRRSTDATSRSRRSLGLDSRSSMAFRASDFEEFDPFLPHSRSSSPSAEMTDQPRARKVSSFWMLPLVLLSNFSRGMSTSPRIEVYTQIACDEIHNNISKLDMPSSLTYGFNVTPPLTPFSLVPRNVNLYHEPWNLETLISSSLSYNSLFYEHDIHSGNLSYTRREFLLDSTPPVECLHDPAVQSRAATIQATLATVIGVLSIITAGYWGQISDAFGRKIVLSLNMLGMVSQSVVYALVNIPNSFFRRYAWQTLLLGPVIEGFFGSLTTHHAAENAYLADGASSGSRSTIFAYYQGAAYISLALGPQIASLTLAITGTDPRTTMFNLALMLDTSAFVYALFMPETVTPEMMRAARRSLSNEEHYSESMKLREVWKLKIKEWRDKLLSPLTIFAPKRRPQGGWEYNLTLLVIAQFTHLMSVGIWQLKLLYAQHTYAWSVKELGYYISLLWTLRAFHLLLLLPTILRFVRPTRSPRVSVALSQDLTFDYRVAQASILVETTAYILTIIAPTSSQMLFVVFTSLSSFTAGVNPAIHSLAVSYLLALNNDANVGRMFGGMSMLQAISHTLQPILFGFVYSETVATYPKSIFVLASGLLLSASAMFTLLRRDVSSPFDNEEVIGNEGTAGSDDEQREAVIEENTLQRPHESSQPLLRHESTSL